MALRIGAWGGGVLVLVACGTPDNGGIEVTFGPPVTSTVPVTTAGGESSSTDASESSSSTGDPDPTTDPLPTTDPTDAETTTESSSGGDDTTTGGADASVECLGLDQATCMVTLGCGWPVGADIFGMAVNGPCSFDPVACPMFDPLLCVTSPACVLDPGTQVCTAITCDVLDQLTCPTIFGCQWFPDMGGGGGFCFAGGLG